MDKFRSEARKVWENINTSLWFIPTIMVISVMALSFFLLWLDYAYSNFITSHFFWLFSGTPSAARSLLSTIASSAITVISIAFSLTIIAIQQASAQYTPRVLRTFTSDRGNQIVLGAYIATFVYSLLILRAVREPEEGGAAGFVPSISASIAILFVLICIALLIYFINHIATSLQAVTIISRVHQELLKQIATLYPDNIGEAITKESKESKNIPEGERFSICSKNGGFVVFVDEETLSKIDLKKASALIVLPKVGDFIVHNQPIAEVVGSKKVANDVATTIRNAISISDQRSASQDPLYVIRQIVDTALKALSPGINDTTTADYCIRFLGDALGILAQKEFPSSVRIFKDNQYKLFLNKPEWDEFVLGAFDQVLHEATDKIEVLEVILRTLHRLAIQIPINERAEPVRILLDKIESVIKDASFLPHDKDQLRKEARAVRAELEKLK